MASGEDNKATTRDTEPHPSREMNWPIVLYYIHLHIGALVGINYIFTEARVLTTLFGKILTLSYKKKNNY
jgi:hypothetical protein